MSLPRPEAGAKVARIWIPLPNEAEGQTLVSLPIPKAAKFSRDPATGNRFAYYEFAPAAAAPAKVELALDVSRVPVAVAQDRPNVHPALEEALAVWLKQDRLGAPEVARAKALAAIGPAKTTWEKARAIYGEIFDSMTYDKTEPGWGNADVARACKVGKGNCTDFHGLFVAMCRSQGIPARMEMGLAVKPDKPTETVGSYHCWASFYAPEHGWVPVDISAPRAAVADPKNASAEQRYAGFARLDPWRIGFGRGTDSALSPPGSGPVRFGLDPVLEVDGKRIAPGKESGFTHAWKFEVKNN
jgi:transglutaminase-like putative cysteine protease